MIEVFSEPGAKGWYAEVWLKVGFQKRLIHRTEDHYEVADKAEEVACEWALGAMTQFFEFYVATTAEQAEVAATEAEIEEAQQEKATGRQKAAAR